MWYKFRRTKMCKNVVFCLKHSSTFLVTSAVAKNEKCCTMFSKNLYLRCAKMCKNVKKMHIKICKNVFLCAKNVQKCFSMCISVGQNKWVPKGKMCSDVQKCTFVHIVAHNFRYTTLVAVHNSSLVAGAHRF